jgi:hypothetical protein
MKIVNEDPWIVDKIDIKMNEKESSPVGHVEENDIDILEY